MAPVAVEVVVPALSDSGIATVPDVPGGTECTVAADCSDDDYDSILGTTVRAGATSAQGWRSNVPLGVTCTLSELPSAGWALAGSSDTTVSPGVGVANFANIVSSQAPGLDVPGGNPGGSGGEASLAGTGADAWTWFLLGFLSAAAGVIAVLLARQHNLRGAFALGRRNP